MKEKVADRKDASQMTMDQIMKGIKIRRIQGRGQQSGVQNFQISAGRGGAKLQI